MSGFPLKMRAKQESGLCSPDSRFGENAVWGGRCCAAAPKRQADANFLISSPVWGQKPSTAGANLTKNSW
jgi:hypothetical protein